MRRPPTRSSSGCRHPRLLAAAAGHRPVLVLVDDVQWLDPESAAAIAFAARRLGPDAVAFLLAAREGTAPAQLSQGLPVLPVAGLSPSSAAMLLPPGAAPCRGASGGRDAGQPPRPARGGGAAGRRALARRSRAPRTGALRRSMARALPNDARRLSADARDAVLYLALVGDAGSAAPAVMTALGHAGINVDQALREACRRGALVEERAGYRIRHPLLRSTLLELATPREQREAHAALAAVLPVSDPNRVWHLAASAVGTLSRARRPARDARGQRP